MPVDSFRFFPRSLATWVQQLEVPPEGPVPWTPLPRPVRECRFALVTTAGLYVKGLEPPFDLEREARQPTWGDPSFRRIPRDVRQEQIGVSHFHINPRDILQDLNVALPIQRFLELAWEGVIGSLTETHYSFMGYQGYPADLSGWRQGYGPQVASLMKAEGVDCVLITPV